MWEELKHIIIAFLDKFDLINIKRHLYTSIVTSMIIITNNTYVLGLLLIIAINLRIFKEKKIEDITTINN